ncbi:MAG: hypothetical protein KA767_04230 [Saprospiraceae bacterium]|nr:hypothetical protein [Saprospiraceae bacterium]
MSNIQNKINCWRKTFLLILLGITMVSFITPVIGQSSSDQTKPGFLPQPYIFNQKTTFPQIHTNLNGMVTEFVRSMHQDHKGNYWFGTNTNGIIRYNGQYLEQMPIVQNDMGVSVRAIVEDKMGNIWFGTSSGLVKYDGVKFTVFSTSLGLQHEEIWGLFIDSQGLIWVGSIGGLSHFDGKKFTPFLLPESSVENPQHMLSDKLVIKILEDRNGKMWLVTDGNGIFTYKQGVFNHLTNKNGLTDNQVADVLADKKGNIWIGTFNGGVSKFNGKTYTNFTKDGIIDGLETYNFCEDQKGNIWFSAEHHGVYRYDGTHFTNFTTENGLTTNGVQSIMEDNKGQLWFGTWQGMSIYDGQNFMNASKKEPWTN